ncbi:Tfp pilus assembly protein PilF [Cognatiyoonia sediminum]|uniref:Tfp pilus assembly protein PilF n=1 Tax=Cognatiyoonia sediminum TaxID=1508389 RepID=A0A1M5Q240_9RHOB|nr:tetratricopeptide repeat protein [Cognatiyoonia sediminum]SHH07789.1 Tfp pilus assembly protein PilF [Cognatiyoonia sediminum]
MMNRTSKIAIVAILAFSLAACKTAEERAEERYQSGLNLLESGDAARAIIEFRNVLEVEGNHVGARETLAQIFLDQGDIGSGYNQLLRLAEQYPREPRFRVQLARLAFDNQSWDEFQRHGGSAVELSPEDTEVAAIDLGLKYQEAIEGDDLLRAEALAAEAESLVSELPNNSIIRNMLIDNAIRGSRIDDALVHIDHMISQDPENLRLHQQRLAILAQKQDPDLLEQQLLTMIETFPEEDEIQSTLFRFYTSTGNIQAAEDFLRNVSDPSDEDPSKFLDLIRFVTEVNGPEAGKAEIVRAIASNPNKAPFEALLASIEFAEGKTSEAIADMERIISEIEPSEQRRGIQVGLAKMLIGTGNEVGARRLVEEVLAEYTLQVEALKLQARWQIEADDTDSALLSLRTALDANPDDTEAHELLAEAYQRAGNHELARESLSRAVETSGNAPEQSIRYASALMERRQFLPSENVLLPALRLSPGNPELLAVLGRLYLEMDDQPRAKQVIDTLRRLDTDRTNQIANALQADQLRSASGIGEAVVFLEQLAASSEGGLDAQLLLLRGHLAAGDTDAAQELVQKLIEDNPNNRNLPYALAAVKGASGDLDGAADDYRKLLEDNPNSPRIWLELSRILARTGDTTAAEEVIQQGLAENNDDPNLLWARASILETDNRIEEAIEIYEQLYERASDSIIVANNLASLLSVYRTDEESLERAFTVARRFKDTDIPALQDTYGWILHRRGDSAEAVPYLQNAAKELDDDPLAQYHLAMAYIATGDTENAKVQLQKVLDVAGPVDTRPQIEDARLKLAELSQAPIEQ